MTIATFHDLPGCELELVPDAGITLAGSLVSVQADQSGHGRDASIANAIADGLATATGPVYAASDATFGGKPSITYNMSALTDCLATPNFGIDIDAPWTLLIAGRWQNPQGGSGGSVSTKLAALSSLYANISVFHLAAFGPFDADPSIWNFAVPIATTPRRIVSADMIAPFVMCLAVRSTTFGTVYHNGMERARRAMPAVANNSVLFRGARLGVNWRGQLPLMVLYSRELSRSEAKDAMLLAGSKCGITWATGRRAA
jgi:hypothetical protein